MITSDDKWFSLSRVTMGQIFASPKRVFLVFHEYLTIFTNQERFGIFSEKGRYNSKWHDTNNTDILLEGLEKGLNDRKDEFMDRLHVTQFVLTIQGNSSTIMKFILMRPPSIE